MLILLGTGIWSSEIENWSSDLVIGIYILVMGVGIWVSII